MAVMLGAAAIGAIGNVAAAGATAAPVMPGFNEMHAETVFDSSGWNVAFPGARIESSRTEGVADPIASVMGGGYMPWVVLGAAVLLLWRVSKRS